jgi:hypothetical protein
MVEKVGRKNSGRKPVADKKVTVCVYPPNSRIELMGMEKAKEVALEAIEKHYKKINKK